MEERKDPMMNTKSMAQRHKTMMQSETYAQYVLHFGPVLDWDNAKRVCAQHGVDLMEAESTPGVFLRMGSSVRTLDLFEWLGY